MPSELVSETPNYISNKYVKLQIEGMPPFVARVSKRALTWKKLSTPHKPTGSSLNTIADPVEEVAFSEEPQILSF